MIPRVEICLDDIHDVHLVLFEGDCNLLRELLSCPRYLPNEDHHKYAILCHVLAPEHVKWLMEDMDGWCLVEFTPNGGFKYWFTNESDAISFKLSFS